MGLVVQWHVNTPWSETLRLQSYTVCLGAGPKELNGDLLLSRHVRDHTAKEQLNSIKPLPPQLFQQELLPSPKHVSYSKWKAPIAASGRFSPIVNNTHYLVFFKKSTTWQTFHLLGSLCSSINVPTGALVKRQRWLEKNVVGTHRLNQWHHLPFLFTCIMFTNICPFLI